MTLGEAIEDLKSIPPWPNENDDPHYLDAVKLGIEALKRVKACRERTDIYPKYLLPGETEE